VGVAWRVHSSGQRTLDEQLRLALIAVVMCLGFRHSGKNRVTIVEPTDYQEEHRVAMNAEHSELGKARLDGCCDVP
jgi:hypothetical protein